MGELTYAPLDAHLIPTLSGIMLLILSLLLLVVAVHTAKNKNTNKLFISLIGVSAIILGSGGFKIVTDVNAGLFNLDQPGGGNVLITEFELNDYKNTSGVPLQITGVDISTISCSQYQADSSLGECTPGKILNNNESCNIDCSPPASGVIQFASADYTVSEAAGTVTVTATRVGGDQGTLSVDVTSADGTATAGDDYNGLAAPLTLTWADNDTANKTITFPILPDALPEAAETFTVTMTATNPAWLGTDTTATITINDDPPGTIQFANADYIVSEAAGAVTVTMTRIGGDQGALSVDVTSADGTATAGDDYNGLAAPLTLTWADGDTANKTITFPILPDALPEAAETFTVTMTATNPAWLGTTPTTTITINDDPPGTIQFANADYIVSEAAGAVTVTMTRIGGDQGALSVDVTSADGTATAGDDYNGLAAPLTLTWADGDTANKTITFPILPDALPEAAETFTVTMTATNLAWLGTTPTTTITITDGPPP